MLKNSIISILAVIVLFVVAGSDAKIVKANHTDLLGKLTAVPLSAQDAFSKCIKEKEGSLKVNSSIKSVSDQLEAYIKENAVPYITGPAGQGHVPQNMPTKEQMRKMSQKEKIEFAMKMQSQMNTNTTPKNTAAWSKCIELNNKFTELSINDPLRNKLMEFEMKYSPEHDKITEETEASVKTCPVLSTGESSTPDEKCVKAKKLAGIDRQIVVTAKELGELRNILATYTNRIKGLLAELDQLMNEVKFGDAVDDDQSKTMLNQAQGLALQQLIQIQAVVQSAYTKAADWIVQKQNISGIK